MKKSVCIIRGQTSVCIIRGQTMEFRWPLDEDGEPYSIGKVAAMLTARRWNQPLESPPPTIEILEAK